MGNNKINLAANRPLTIFVVGGVMSGVGKGVSTASIATLLKECDLNVTTMKIDPYINVDAGTINPIEHGEVFVTHDGLETDQDIGNYERFLNQNILRVNYMTTGQVYRTVIENERALKYGGRTVEAVPDIPLEIIRRIKKAQQINKSDVTLVEIGGTLGEYQNVLFLEAARMMKRDNPKDVLMVLVSYLPVPSALGEMKTKPTQAAIKLMNETGLFPDFVIARSTHVIDEVRKEKLSRSCGLSPADIIAAPDVKSIYSVPSYFKKQGVAQRILDKFGLDQVCPKDTRWDEMKGLVEKEQKNKVKIGVVGKYFSTGDFVLSDVYLCVLEALKHAGWNMGVGLDVVWINSEEIEQDKDKIGELLGGLQGIVVPGGFGVRGIEGKLETIKYVRENNIPYLGLCYGMQLAIIETARNVLNLEDANTTEIDPSCKNPVIHLMNEQEEKMKNADYGGSMRLGACPCHIQKDSLAFKLYDKDLVEERHRHRYEVNIKYKNELEKEGGLLFSGVSPDENLMEIAERSEHRFFIATQFHPEFLSRPFNPHPLFLGFLKASLEVDKN